jgi:hypothetical protein
MLKSPATLSPGRNMMLGIFPIADYQLFKWLIFDRERYNQCFQSWYANWQTEWQCIVCFDLQWKPNLRIPGNMFLENENARYKFHFGHSCHYVQAQHHFIGAPYDTWIWKTTKWLTQGITSYKGNEIIYSRGTRLSDIVTGSSRLCNCTAWFKFPAVEHAIMMRHQCDRQYEMRVTVLWSSRTKKGAITHRLELWQYAFIITAAILYTYKGNSSWM